MTRSPRPGKLANPRFPPELPITPRIGEIVDALRRHQVLIVAGETGSGKTTQLPKACLAAGLARRGTIAHTQPRRLAARTVAARIAEELGVELGAEVGYAVRFSERVSDATRVKVMTDGLLLNDIQRDRELKRYGCVIVDEAHERSLNVDFILGYLRRLIDRRDDLRVIITSATIDVDTFAKHFKNAPVVEVSGRGYPVETVYLPVEDDPEAALVECLTQIATRAPAGRRDILVFQPGEREILDTSRLLKRAFADRFEIMPLYARLPAREQARIFVAGRRQRIVLATNVAETSITVPNIGYVIDPGFARVSRYSYRAKLQRLLVEPISQASARQRAGRCGRVAPGICYRLYDEDDHDSRPAYTDPELTRTNLAAVVLAMRAFGLGDIETFPFIDPPDTRAVRDAVGLLHELQALEDGELTAIGRAMARLPVDPRLARMLIEAAGTGSGPGGALTEVLVIVSALAAQDPRQTPLDRREAADRAHAAFAHPQSDLLAYLNLWQWLEEARSGHGRSAFERLLEKRFLSPARVREWRSLHRQLLLACRSLGMRENRQPASYAAVHRAMLAGSLGFIGQKTEPPDQPAGGKARGRRRSAEYDGARGLRFRLFPGSALVAKPPKWVFAAEISVTGRTYARGVASVEPPWIEAAAAHIVKRSYSEPRWDKARGEAMVRERVTVYGLTVVGQRPKRAALVDPEAAREIFVREALLRDDARIEAPFLASNRRVIGRVQERQAKGRRADLLVGESRLASFYLDRLPKDVSSIATCNHYLERAFETELARFQMTEADVIAGADVVFDEADFPTRLPIEPGDREGAALEVPLAYKFAPGEPDDGVSLRVELGLLAELDQDALDWLVPGFLEDKCLALLRGLPKALRRRLAPVRDRVGEILPTLRDPANYRCGRLATAMSSAIRKSGGVEIPADAWRMADLPDHLKMNVQVRDRRGRRMDQDRDLEALKGRLLAEAEQDILVVVRKTHERLGIDTFPDTGVPASIVVSAKGSSAVVYPVLVDRGDSVDLLMQSIPGGRESLNRDGYTRLALLAEPRTARGLRRDAEGDVALAMHFVPMASAGRLVDELVRTAFWFAFFEGRELPVTKTEFTRCISTHRGTATPIFHELLEGTRTVLKKRLEVVRRLDALGSPAFARSRKDLVRQLDGLVGADFLRATPRDRLPDLPRLLDGMAHRIDNLQGRVDRDRAGIEAVAVWEQRLATLREAGDVSSDVIDDLRFLIEEFRIATFSQQLGTREKVSAKRLAGRFETALRSR